VSGWEPATGDGLAQRLRRRSARERTGRKAAEQLLETKLRELLDANRQLTALATDLRDREAYAQQLFLSAKSGILVVSANGTVDAANGAAMTLLGCREDEIIGIPLSRIIDLGGRGFTPDLDGARFEAALRPLAQRPSEVEAVRKDGTVMPLQITVGEAHLSDRVTYILVLRDLTKEREAALVMQRLAFFDPLTELGNRYWIRRQFEDLAVDGDREICLMYIDVDSFERINDDLGHFAGDEVLVALARRLEQRPAHAADAYRFEACRMSADEFVILAAQGTQPVAWPVIAEEVRSRVSDPMLVSGSKVSVTASIGYSVGRILGTDFDRLTNEADIAMRRAKDEGNHECVPYQLSMGYRTSGTVALEEGVRSGLERGEFRAYFQPQVDVESGRITGAEALVRWHHPEAGVLLPGRFLPAINGTDLIVEMGEAVLAQVLLFQRKALERGVACPIAVNISGREYGSHDLVSSFREAATWAGVAPELIVIELTEEIVATHTSDLSQVHQFDESGFRIAIDDFGVAQSSLARLRALPVSKLKIDRSFVRSVPGSRVDNDILRAMFSLGSATNAEVIVEGVEGLEQIEFIRGLGSCSIQGFFYSPAVPAEEFLTMLVEQPWMAVGA
jgi:diguanylate cyclase (GGDEF)-like protein/PAS domain S-box-containing protein